MIDKPEFLLFLLKSLETYSVISYLFFNTVQPYEKLS